MPGRVGMKKQVTIVETDETSVIQQKTPTCAQENFEDIMNTLKMQQRMKKIAFRKNKTDDANRLKKKH